MSADPRPTNSSATAEGRSRREVIQGGFAATGSLFLAGAARHRHRSRGPRRPRRPPRAPNILVIMVDQLRSPAGPVGSPLLDAQMPNLAALRRRSVDFQRHYTAANDCSPARSSLLTGLHTHQTGCLITGRSKLDPGFPTWGTLLREIGYHTYWYGKWHLNPRAKASLEPYGFAGGTYPSPNGAPGQGTEVDPHIARQFAYWYRHAAGDQPWCTTVSFVNPHDVAWWYRFTEELQSESSPAQLIGELPVNFETPEQLAAGGKPAVQRSLQATAARSFGAVPFTGPRALEVWCSLLNTYLLLQRNVDQQIGGVLRTLLSNRSVAANTVIVFTSDHGEYGGAHGLRGKGAGVYEEAIRVPLHVFDPRGVATSNVAIARRQLSSSVDVLPLLLSIATGSRAWRRDSRFAHLAHRADLAGICADPRARGRQWILHVTDEDVTEFASDVYAAQAARHVIALRSGEGKIGLYSHWLAGTMDIRPEGQEAELYDYSTGRGRAETENVAGRSELEDRLRTTLLEQAIPDELRAPLPQSLIAAQARGLENYREVEEYEIERVEYSHLPQLQRSESELSR